MVGASADAIPRELQVLSEVAAAISAAVEVDHALSVVAGALRRGLGLASCRVWVRTPDGAAFRAVVAPGDPVPEEAARLTAQAWLDVERGADHANGIRRIPLQYEGERLGMLEAAEAPGSPARFADVVLTIVADILSPLLASLELSEDLASEVALRTREIEAQRRFTAKIIDTLPVGLYVIDRDYRIQAWNRKRETGTQGIVRDEALGRPVFEVLRRQPRDLLRREFDAVFDTGRIEQMEVESSASGEPRYYRLTKIPMRLNDTDVTHVITIGEDITEWKTVQQEIAQTEKLAAVGQLAAGVMHEINNPLATIGACLEALESRREDLDPGHQHIFDEYFRIMESELARCKRIVDGLLDFSRPKARAKKPVPVNQVVEDALFLVKHHDRFKGIRLVRQLADGLPKIEANAEQLIQAFLALMLNAIDAMEGKGVLTVSTATNPERSDEVMVTFSDTGVGITRDDLGKIFEPFFTTKLPGQGTGLGLSICYAVISEHRGRITVDSAVGRGSTFYVYLPVSTRQGDDA
ncbi:MAG TPA: ATP-binding protein [Gemmatimonadales bacterium]|nr:ATP-binding protein [Gemmatimonadales bacterium]